MAPRDGEWVVVVGAVLGKAGLGGGTLALASLAFHTIQFKHEDRGREGGREGGRERE